LIIVPAHNEADVLADVLDDLRKHFACADIVVINDGSTDATSAVARREGAEVVDLPCNLGVGTAMQTGYAFAAANHYDVAVQFDGDGQHRANLLGRLVEPILRGEGSSGGTWKQIRIAGRFCCSSMSGAEAWAQPLPKDTRQPYSERSTLPQ